MGATTQNLAIRSVLRRVKQSRKTKKATQAQNGWMQNKEDSGVMRMELRYLVALIHSNPTILLRSALGSGTYPIHFIMSKKE